MRSKLQKIRKALVLILLLDCLKVFSQAELPKIIPPNPISQEFQKFLGYPVSGATGLVDISIPLYELKLNGLTIPFSLKYHSSGVKVDQADGILGYGWSLFPGLKITRTIMGKADEFWTTDNMNAPVNNEFLVDIALPADRTDPAGSHDGQYDIFTIHLPSVNGSFILKRVNDSFEAVTIPSLPLKIATIEHSGNAGIIGFQVTDDKGVVYHFGREETTTPSWSYGETTCSAGCFNTGWMLRKITLPGVDNEVDFSYDPVVSSVIPLPIPQSLSVYDDGSATDVYPYFGASGAGAFNYNENPIPDPPVIQSIKSISFPNGSIQFTYSSGSGVYSAYGDNLVAMQVLGSGQPVRSIAFTMQDHLLRTVAISGQNKYQFEYYNETAFSELNTFYKQDRWGHFNNENHSGIMIPQIELTINAGSQLPYNLTYGNALRTVDTVAMKANALKKIIYPTGGYSLFQYQPHQFIRNGNTMHGGGLRIYKIESFDPESSSTLTKTFKYGQNENGLANVTYYPEDHFFVNEAYLFGRVSNLGYGIRCRRRTISSHSSFRFFSFNTPFWYDEVTEYSDGGKTIYNYSYTPDVILQNGTSLGSNMAVQNYETLHTLNNLVYGDPSLMRKRVYKFESGSFGLLQEENNGYTVYDQSIIPGMIVDPAGFFIAEGGQVTSNSQWLSGDQLSIFGIGLPFHLYGYSIVTGRQNLTSTEQIDYSSGNSMTRLTTYAYDNDHPYNVLSTESLASDNSLLKDYYYYPTSTSIPDIEAAQVSVIDDLETNNRLTTLIQKTTFKGAKPVSGIRFNYRDWGNGIFQPEIVSTKEGNNPYQYRIRYHSYDNKGNVTSVSKENDHLTSYLYDYNEALPVAEITGASGSETAYTSFEADGKGNWTYSGSAFVDATSPTGRKSYNLASGSLVKPELTSTNTYIVSYWYRSGSVTVTGGTLSDVVNKPGPDGWTLVTGKITGATSVSVSGTAIIDEVRLVRSGSQMTTYTYDPLVGVTSVADANSATTYYEYDSAGRLIRIRDKDKNITRSHVYHYKGE